MAKGCLIAAALFGILSLSGDPTIGSVFGMLAGLFGILALYFFINDRPLRTLQRIEKELQHRDK